MIILYLLCHDVPQKCILIRLLVEYSKFTLRFEEEDIKYNFIMDKLEAIRNGQWYVVCDLNKSLEELVRVCETMRKAVTFITTQVEEGNLTNESLAKMVVSLKYTMTRMEGNVCKLVQFMRQLILTFDKVILVMHNNIMAEHEAVKDMLSKVVEPYHHQLSESTKHLVKKKKKSSKPCPKPIESELL